MNTGLTSARPEIRSELADVLGRLRDFRTIETLISLLQDPEWRVRWKVLKSFERVARTGPLTENAGTALFDYKRGELAAYRYSLLCSRTLIPHSLDEGHRVLQQALEEDRGKIEERVFRVLGVLCGREQMQAVFQRLNSTNPRLNADAVY